MRESGHQRKIVKHLERIGATVFNQAGASPDLLVCYQGRFIGLEVKRPDLPPSKQEPSEMQKYLLRKIRASGGIAGVVTSIEDVNKLLKAE